MSIVPAQGPRHVKGRELRLGYRHTELALFDMWVAMYDHRVPYFNNEALLPREILAGSMVASLGELYLTLPKPAYDDFRAWAEDQFIIEIEVQGYCCNVEGEVRRDHKDGVAAEVRFEVEDVLLTRHAFGSLAQDVREAMPDWLPFFFRGGVPPGLAVVGDEFHRVHPKAEDSVLLKRLHWFPGLGDDRRAGVDTKRLFQAALEAKLAEGNEILRVWAIDTTKTGSSAPTKIINAVKGLPEELRRRVDLTLAMVVPVVPNAAWAHDPEKAHLVRDGLHLGVVDPDGREAILRPLPGCPGIGGLRVRVYPVRNSLSEDNDDALEMQYLRPPTNGKPVFGMIYAEQLHLVVTRGDEVHRDELDAKTRGDPAYDWLFNEFNSTRLRRVLRELGLSWEPGQAVEDLLDDPAFKQYRPQGAVVHEAR